MIAVGVDTHKERHFAVALDALGEVLGESTFAATAAGYAELQRWAERHGDLDGLVFGIEGAGSWGAGLCEHLQRAGHAVVEVERPRRAERRAGKSDRIDALAAAKHVLVGEKLSTPRRRGTLSALRALLKVRRQTIAERTRLLNQLQALNVTAPVALRERIGAGTGKQLERRLLSTRVRPSADIEEHTVFGVMRDLAARSRALAADAQRYERELAELVRSLDPTLLDEPGIGPISAAKLFACDRGSLQARSSLRPLQRHRPTASLLGQNRPPQAQPRWRPPSQQRDPHHRAHPRQAPAQDARLPRPPHQRGKDQARSHARPQTPHLPRPLQTPRRGPLDFIEASLKWEACEDAPAVQCSTLRVPLDWSRPKGPEVSLALTRLPASDRDHRVGSVLFNCGGPGCPGAQVVKLAPDVFTPRLRERFDIVGFDPRATGESTPVRCGLPSFDPSIPRYPGNEADFQRLLDFNRALARSCREMTGPYLMHVGAPDVVRDMEAIRAALRDGKLNWLGLSYGTMLGALYAERYPKRIRTLVLDGALDRALSEPGMLGAEARASADEFERWAAWCQTSPECPLQGQDVLRIWDDLIAAANRSPIPASNVGRGVTGEEIQNFTDDNYLIFKRPTAFGPDSWLSFGPAIVKALNGDASDFAYPIGEPPTNPFYGQLAIECLDWPIQARTFAELTGRITIARIISPHLGGATQTGRIISSCLGWPRPKTDPRHFLDIHGAPPSLIVNATHDPSTSYVWALSMQAQIPRSVLLTRDGDGHTSYLSSSCAQEAIDRYLIERVLPDPGTVCLD